MMSTMVRAPPQSGSPQSRVDADYSFVIGVDGPAGMLLQLKHRLASVVRCFPGEEKSSHVHQPA
jgi:hypothetical protein